jgi:hypothetical protein
MVCLGLVTTALGCMLGVQMAAIALSARKAISFHGTSQLSGSAEIGRGGTDVPKGPLTPSCDCVT